MALIEGCKHTLEVTIPSEEVEQETVRVIDTYRQKAKLPGFRPGKVPADLVRRKYHEDIREEVVRNLIPRHLGKRFEEEHLNVVGSPNIKDLHFHEGEAIHFKAEFEVAPEIELKDLSELAVRYAAPEVTDEEVEARLNTIRDQKAEYINVDPRPLAEGDHAVVSLESLTEMEAGPVKQEETMLHIGDPDTMSAFSENLRGLSPGEEKEFEVSYPEDFGQEKLAGKAIRFHAVVKGIRRKELPELNDEFAKDVGDFQSLEELRVTVRRAILSEKEYKAQSDAKDEIVAKLVDMHDFPVPEAYIERQIEIVVENHLRTLAAQGVDPRKVKLDWNKIQESQRQQAIRDVKASLLLDRVAEREAIITTNDEVDQEVQRIARQQREPVAAVRMRLEKEKALGRIAGRIRTEKTLAHLFEHATKVAAE